MNLNNYVITNDDGYPSLQYYDNSDPEHLEDHGQFIMFVDAGISLHDIMIKIQHFENNKNQNQENGN